MKDIHNLYIVDDDDIFRYLTQKIIKDQGLVDKIWQFTNGMEAITHLNQSIEHKNSLPEIILLDLTMPIMDGWEFLDEFDKLRKEFKKSISIFVVSSTISPSDIQKIHHYITVKDFVIKPITRHKFVDILENL